jgi:hypothetical protein
VDVPADPDGRWSARDQLAHLGWWRTRSAAVIASVRTRAELPPVAGSDNEQNAVIYAATKDRSAADIKRDTAGSWTSLRAALEASADEDLVEPHPEYPELEVWEAVPGMAGHLGAHLMSWFMETGDVVRAEAAAKWAYELECSFFPPGVKRAEAKYNLACFYSRAGRAEEAMPLLLDSLRDSSELKSWAREDPDLAAIRDDPRFRELLGES